ncbi:GatB/YqeY domain-containing protein [Dermacoccus nishinomiyaensis]|uniref:GatB/YqeY domain-containing protein n=1 Tax=Dermacoccus TaxID=57495 RepID=UPI0001E64605|nr:MULTISPECIES: GatB/YqeY domain-containing protein [Dermacoccus]EFP58967.1 YqeY-like protein [Dermacoccus sp. Ellin185]MBO1757052.1 GatB/YqeY domain-containing protein [Dermacoccus sp. NHGro5]MCG7428807.1 GatB/YqeY domain-containing protein [Dermacoccus nishinomiyaensis]MCT1604959.1 GatB/YqeY domain-containing protein [Dermacoccus nishinomiyaensis]NHC31127.1 GatB/YqeY domain-containing protein [Dermacoccus nishinomiyaensis]
MNATGATTLKATLHTDLTDAIRERDQVRSATLRMVLTAVSNAEVAGKEHRELSDDEVLAVIVKEAKKRREAADAYVGAGRTELAEKENAELACLEGYLPKQLSDDEIDAIVAEAVSATGASGMKDMGKVMGVVKPKIGEQAEGGRVAAAVKKALAG